MVNNFHKRLYARNHPKMCKCDICDAANSAHEYYTQLEKLAKQFSVYKEMLEVWGSKAILKDYA